MSQKLLEHADMGLLNVVESFTNGQDMSALLCIISAPADYTLHCMYIGDGTFMIGGVGNCVRGWTHARVPLLLFPTKAKMIKGCPRLETSPV